MWTLIDILSEEINRFPNGNVEAYVDYLLRGLNRNYSLYAARDIDDDDREIFERFLRAYEQDDTLEYDPEQIAFSRTRHLSTPEKENILRYNIGGGNEGLVYRPNPLMFGRGNDRNDFADYYMDLLIRGVDEEEAFEKALEMKENAAAFR